VGFSLSWLAVKRIPESTLLSGISATRTGKSAEIPEHKLSYLDRGNEWRWIFADHLDIIHERSGWLSGLSRGTELISVFVEEHVMYSAATCWKDGKQIWFIEHDNDRGGLEDIRASGDLPSCYQRIFNDLQQKLKEDPECDFMFDVPTEVAKELTGYKHDDMGEPGDTFWELESTEKAKSWLSSLFGRK
jgi:hypothetical protein